MFSEVMSTRLQNSRFRKAQSAVSVNIACEAREPHKPACEARVRKKYDRLAVKGDTYLRQLPMSKRARE